MTFSEFMPLIHNGFFGEIYLVNPEEGGLYHCKDADDFRYYARLIDDAECGNVEVCGVQPYRANAIIVEYMRTKAR